MTTTVDFIDYVYEQIQHLGEVRYRKMFGDYMVYINNKPVLLVCDNVPYVKMAAEIADLMKNAETGIPYDGAKDRYILDIENPELRDEVLLRLEKITPLPKPKSRKKKSEK